MNHQSEQTGHPQDQGSPTDDQKAPERQSRDGHNAKTRDLEDALAFLFDDFVQYDRQAISQRNRAFKELAEFSVVWDEISDQEAAELRAVIDSSSDERPIQDFLRDNPKFLVQALAGGHDRFQIAKQKLGSEFVPDFVVAEAHSFGLDWYLVEIESPKAELFRKDGEPRTIIHHAIGQIRDWRTWLASNRDYARRARRDHGLGLAGIESQAPGLILIGRRTEFSEKFNEFRRATRSENGIVIHTYDWLLEVADSNRSGRLRFEFRA